MPMIPSYVLPNKEERLRTGHVFVPTSDEERSLVISWITGEISRLKAEGIVIRQGREWSVDFCRFAV
jgi:hypothetical protein